MHRGNKNVYISVDYVNLQFHGTTKDKDVPEQCLFKSFASRMVIKY